MRRSVVIFGLVATACGPTVSTTTGGGADGSGTSSATPTETSNGDGGITTVPPASDTIPMDVTTVAEDDDASFVGRPDVTVEPGPCSLWDPDCPAGYKCMPVSADGVSEPGATICVELHPDPQPVGESCMVFDGPTSGHDNCGAGSTCWNPDFETLMGGECVEFCRGSEAEPTCNDPCATCYISPGVLTLCLSVCDPLAQDCGEGQGCYAITGGFACATDASVDEGAVGSECEYVNACEPGNVCADSTLVPGCGGTGCCAPFCDVEAVDTCDSLLPGTSCVPWEGNDPVEPACALVGAVGVCALPS